MSLKYRIDVLSALKEAGFSTYKLQKEQLLSNSSVQKIRAGEIVSAANISKLCQLLRCQPGDLLEFIEEE